jgi:hypothetical protein
MRSPACARPPLPATTAIATPCGSKCSSYSRGTPSAPPMHLPARVCIVHQPAYALPPPPPFPPLLQRLRRSRRPARARSRRLRVGRPRIPVGLGPQGYRPRLGRGATGKQDPFTLPSPVLVLGAPGELLQLFILFRYPIPSAAWRQLRTSRSCWTWHDRQATLPRPPPSFSHATPLLCAPGKLLQLFIPFCHPIVSAAWRQPKIARSCWTWHDTQASPFPLLPFWHAHVGCAAPGKCHPFLPPPSLPSHACSLPGGSQGHLAGLRRGMTVKQALSPSSLFGTLMLDVLRQASATPFSPIPPCHPMLVHCLAAAKDTLLVLDVARQASAALRSSLPACWHQKGFRAQPPTPTASPLRLDARHLLPTSAPPLHPPVGEGADVLLWYRRGLPISASATSRP